MCCKVADLSVQSGKAGRGLRDDVPFGVASVEEERRKARAGTRPRVWREEDVLHKSLKAVRKMGHHLDEPRHTIRAAESLPEKRLLTFIFFPAPKFSQSQCCL